MNKKVKTALISVCCVIVAAGVFVAGFFTGRSALDKDVATLNYIITMYKRYYYEETDDIIGLVESVLLDKYSDYYTKEEYDVIKKTAMGRREGVGFSYNSQTNVITQVIGNSPAKKAGVKEGGKIIGAGLTETTIKSTADHTVDELLSEIPVNTDFIFRVDYSGKIVDHIVSKREYVQTFVSYYDETGEYGFTDKSGKMSFERISDNVDFPMDGKNKTAFLRYSGFNGLSKGIDGSATQFKMALERFRDTQKTCLILDLRNNGGGYMNILESIASHLICQSDGSVNLISYAEYKDGKRSEFYSTGVDYGRYNFEKIVILANQNSASASEALMGAVLDYDQNKIVNVILEGSLLNGETVYKSYGKGIMQSTYTRITGEAIKLTTAKIFWPKSGISIHGVGLTPTLDERILPESEKGAYYDALSLCK